MKDSDLGSRKYRVGWRGLFSLPISLLDSSSDTQGCFFLLALILAIPEYLFSYLRTTPEGIQVRYWPFHQIQVSWNAVEKLGSYKVLGFIPSDALYLKQNAPFGSVNILSREIHLGKKQRVIILNDFQGWKNGQLLNDLYMYIPEIIEESNK